jgi:hypothetical protein
MLRTLGAAGASAAIAGCSLFEGDDDDRQPTDTPTATPEATETRTATPTRTEEIPYVDEYDTVVDLGQRGADPSGESDVIPLFEEYAGDDTLLYLPEGTYLMADDWLYEEFTDLAIVGPEATIRPPDGYRRTLFLFGDASGLRIEGLTFDFTAESTGARPLNARVDDGLLVRDVTVRGRQDVDQDMMRFDVTDPEGSGLVERMRLPDGAVRDLPITGCLVTASSEGDLTFRDCEIAGFPDNGLYASASTGNVTVEGGHYRNNAIANVRVGDGALVRNVRVTADYPGDGYENTRGIRLREGGSARVESCTVELLSARISDGAITVATHMREAEIVDTTIRIDIEGVAAVLAKSPIDEYEDDDDVSTALTLRNVEVTGSARQGAAVTVVDRDDSRFEGLCIRQTGDNRDGVRLLRANDNRITDAGIDVTGEPIVLEESTAETVGIRRSCDRTTPTDTPQSSVRAAVSRR